MKRKVDTILYTIEVPCPSESDHISFEPEVKFLVLYC